MTNPVNQSSCRVRVRDLPLLASVGINPDEINRRQPLIVSIELLLDKSCVDEIKDSVDYRQIVQIAEGLADKHVPLIETFASRLATECLGWPSVTEAAVSVDKPFALTRGMAGTEVTLRR